MDVGVEQRRLAIEVIASRGIDELCTDFADEHVIRRPNDKPLRKE